MHKRNPGLLYVFVCCALIVIGPRLAAVAQNSLWPQQLFATAVAGPGKRVDHSTWNRLLKAYVRPQPDGLNRVDYAAFKREAHATLKSYIRSLCRSQRAFPARAIRPACQPLQRTNGRYRSRPLPGEIDQGHSPRR